MAQQHHHPRSPQWLSARPSTARHRTLVFFGLFLLGLLVFGSIWLISEETMRMERRDLEKRQFMLSGLLSGQSREVAQPAVVQDDTFKHEAVKLYEAADSTARQPTPPDSSPHSSTEDIADLTEGSPTPRVDDITEINPAQDSSANLIEALSEALKNVIGEPAPGRESSSSAPHQQQEQSSTVESPSLSSQNPLSTWTSTLTSSTSTSISISTPLSTSASTSTQSMASTTSARPQQSSPDAQLSNSKSERTTSEGTNAPAASSTLAGTPVRKLNYSNGLFGELLKLAIAPRAIDAGVVPRTASTDGVGTRTTGSLSMLSSLSNIVAQLAGVDIGAAARLTDAVLGVLSVDISAVASIIPQVAGKASLQNADVMPFILPAVAKALGAPLSQNPSFNYSDHVGTLNIIVQQGAAVINEITNTPENTVGASLKAVLNQVAGIVYSMAGQLDEPLCALSQTVNETTYQTVIPCAAAGLDGTASTTGVITAPVPTVVGGVSIATASWSRITLEPPGTYGQPDSPTPTAIADGPSAGDDSDPSGANSGADNQVNSASLPDSYGPDPSQASPAAVPATSPSAAGCSIPQSASLPAPYAPIMSESGTAGQPSCPLVPPSTAIQCHDCPSSCTGSGNQASDPSAGPCPSSGFSCADCPDGWFCPPQQTPAQAAPCGKGWPCYACKSGWFCPPENDLPSAPTPSATSTDCPSTSTEASPSSTSGNIARAGDDPNSASGADPGASSAGIPANWVYLGCFQDAISRTLLRVKPTDYLHGNMSRAACANHCTSRGYTFAGTECGHECWCGASIRDDAVRLPETCCGTPCQGTETEFCGGNWTISVFMCSDGDDGSAQRQPTAVQSTSPESVPTAVSPEQTGPPTYDSMVELLAVEGRLV